MNESANTTQQDGQAPIVGQARSVYRHRPVQPALREHFAHLWCHAVPAGASGRSAIVPDGCVDLLWFDGALVIAGPDRQAKIEHVPPGKMVVGLQFCPGAAANWLRAPVSDVTDARVPLEHFWGRDVRHLAEWVGQEPTPEKIAQRLEEALLHRLSGIATLDRLPLAMFRIVAETQSSSPPVMCRLSRALDLSARTLRRRALDAFGYGPKTLDRILRFQRFLQLAATDTASSLAELAVAAGYADQPHLTRETSRLASFTPDALRTELSR